MVRPFVLEHEGQVEFLAALQQRIDTTRRSPDVTDLSADHRPLSYASARVQGELRHLLEHEAMGSAMTRLLDQAVSQQDITAWVGASDSVALLCMDYLAQQNIAVPGRISVVGFDDGPDAFLGRIASYNFNGTAAVRAMVDWILFSKARMRREEPRVISFEGFVARRHTVAVRQ